MSDIQYYNELTEPFDKKKKIFNPYCLLAVGTSMASLTIISIVTITWYTTYKLNIYNVNSTDY